MKKYLIASVLILIIFGCEKNSQNNSSGLSGMYMEISPTANENQFNFVNNNEVVITSLQAANQLNFVPGTFKYQINGSIMKLTSTSLSMPYTSSYLVNLSGNDSLSLGYNCDCLCPCALSPNILFARK